MIIKICKQCELEYTPKNKGEGGKKSKYCSHKCYNEFEKNNPNSTQFKKGHGINNGRPCREKTRVKIGKANKGKHHTEESNEKNRLAHLGRIGYWKDKKRLDISGEKNWNWKDGITPLNESIRKLSIYEEWEQWIKEWDNYTCQKCGVRGGVLHSHHIKRVSDIIEENHIMTIEEAELYQPLWDVSNGITYCKECHILLKGKGGLL